MIDIGANLTDKSFTDDLPEVLSRATESGVEQIIVTGTSISASGDALSLADAHPEMLVATTGVHPHHADEVQGNWIDELKLLAERGSVAVGETGLDYFRNFSSAKNQRKVFRAQLELATELDMPVFVHDRDSNGETLDHLRRYVRTPTVVHCFTGDEKTLDGYLELGCYIGFTGWICDERRGQEVSRLTAKVPDNRILIETDSPYLLPRSITPRPKTRRNEPSFLPYVLKKLAEERNQDIDELEKLTATNSRTLFRLNDHNQVA